MQRVFIVGCERSGTTILQALLGANSKVVTFPESHFYDRLFGGRRWRLMLGIASRKSRARWKEYLSVIGHDEMQNRLSRATITVRQFSNVFIEVLDTIALHQGKSAWIEKTPGHLFLIGQIEKLINGAKFIHILRNGPDNVASLYEIGFKYTDKWPSNFKRIDNCIQRWISAVSLSMKYSSKTNHLLIHYEKLVTEPIPLLKKLCDFICVPFEEKMLSDYPNVARQVIIDKEPWKAMTIRPIRLEKGRKFFDLFDENERKYVLEKTNMEFK